MRTNTNDTIEIIGEEARELNAHINKLLIDFTNKHSIDISAVEWNGKEINVCYFIELDNVK